MIRIREILDLIKSFIQGIGMRKVKGEVYTLLNFARYTIIIETPEGELCISPLGVLVSVYCEESKYVMKLRGKQLYISPTSTCKIHGLDFLLSMGEREIAIVEPNVFKALRNNPALYERLKRRVVTFKDCVVKKEGSVVVRMYDLEVL